MVTKEKKSRIPIRDLVFLIRGGKRHIAESSVTPEQVIEELKKLYKDKSVDLYLEANGEKQEKKGNIEHAIGLTELFFCNSKVPRKKGLRYNGWHKHYLGEKKELHHIEMELSDGKKEYRKMVIEYKTL